MKLLKIIELFHSIKKAQDYNRRKNIWKICLIIIQWIIKISLYTNKNTLFYSLKKNPLKKVSNVKF